MIRVSHLAVVRSMFSVRGCTVVDSGSTVSPILSSITVTRSISYSCVCIISSSW